MNTENINNLIEKATFLVEALISNRIFKTEETAKAALEEEKELREILRIINNEPKGELIVLNETSGKIYDFEGNDITNNNHKSGE